MCASCKIIRKNINISLSREISEVNDQPHWKLLLKSSVIVRVVMTKNWSEKVSLHVFCSDRRILV